MNDSPRLPARLFDEDEVGRILKRATELHREEPLAPGSGGGMSLEELEDIAREAGIDPRHLRRAAMEVGGGPDDEPVWTRFFGTRPTIVLESEVAGEMDPGDFERVVVAIQRHASEHGQPNVLGRTLTWTAETSGKSRTLQVTVSIQDGVTRVHLEERLHQLAAGIFGGGMGGVGGGLGLGVGLPVALDVVGSAALAVAAPLGVIGLAWIGGRGIFRQIVKRRRRAVARIMDAVLLEVRSAVHRRAVGAPAEAGRLGSGGDPVAR